jgi:hypothetical protein
MGKTATHAVVFAQLHMPGGQCHGLHAFLVQVGPDWAAGVDSYLSMGTDLHLQGLCVEVTYTRAQRPSKGLTVRPQSCTAYPPCGQGTACPAPQS